MINTDLLNDFTMQSAVLIPIITAIVQAFKMTNWVKDKFTPFAAMIVGVGVTFLLAHDATTNISGTILTGILFGLAASGLYSGLQHTNQIIQTERAQKAKKESEKNAQKEDRQNKIN
jgi:F0F1-type ATP synthase assembly protein I